jgi:hypothetical protein
MTDAISRILITCPVTGTPVETVLRMRQSAFDVLQGEHRFRCTRCGEVHSWRREDAWLETVRPAQM